MAEKYFFADLLWKKNIVEWLVDSADKPKQISSYYIWNKF